MNVKAGQVPYRDFSFPYPPGALAVIVAPIVTGSASEQNAYARWFGRLMGVLLLCCIGIAVARRAWRAVIVFAISPLFVGSLDARQVGGRRRPPVRTFQLVHHDVGVRAPVQRRPP